MSDEVNIHFNPKEKKHHHRPRPKRSLVKPIVYGFMSFMLALVLFLLTVCMVLKLTFFSSDFMISSMASCGYYSMVKDELREELVALGHASGLPDSFIDDYVETLDIRQIETNYVNSFYSGSSTLIETNSFKQSFRAAIDQYIVDNNIDKSKANENNLIYLVNEASEIYVSSVSIPFFSVIANYVHKLDGPVSVAMVILAIIAAAIALVIYFTNEYKHRRYRFLCYACLTTMLTSAAIPSIIFYTGIINKVNLGARSLYNLFVTYFSGLFTRFYYFSIVFLIFSFVTFIAYMVVFKKTSRHK